MEGKPPSTTPGRRELQGPRPTPLKVRRDSHKMKKLPPPSGLLLPHLPPPPPLPPRRPVIIYTVSPKVIHADASDFMALVQRLTGNSRSSSSSSEPYTPAARLAAIEKAHIVGAAQQNASEDMTNIHSFDSVNVHSSFSGYGGGGGTFPAGILSPAPSALPPTSPNFFSPMSDPNLMSFLHDLSPAFHGNYTRSSSYSDMITMSNYLASPTIPNFVTNPNLIPPTPPFNPFNQFQGL